MSKLRLIEALRVTAARLRAGDGYQWGHFGACNCGHLAQTLTRRSREEIHRVAVERALDWGHAAVEYCATSGFPLDHILTEMLEVGMTLTEIRHLETLSDRHVLRRLAPERRHLQRNRREDVVLYMETWADMLSDGTVFSNDELPLAAE